jgi:hypothetical protein
VRPLDVLFLSELEKVDDIDMFCKYLGMRVVALCEQTDAIESNALLVREDLPYSDQNFRIVSAGSSRRSRRAIIGNLGDIHVVGVHKPWEVHAEYARLLASQQLIGALALEEKAMIFGDFNTAWFAPSRLMYLKHGFYPVSSLIRDNKHFPAPGYASFSLPPFLRNIYKVQLDDVYTRGIAVASAFASYTQTDHPVIFTRIHHSL